MPHSSFPASAAKAIISLLALFGVCAFASIAHADEPESILYTFAYASGGGFNPRDELLLAPNGLFYGTATGGGSGIDSYSSDGIAFSIDGSGNLDTLHAFGNDNGTANDGQYPYSGLVLGPNGNFYGTTQDGGLDGLGAIFEMTPSGVVTTLHSFDGNGDGEAPVSDVTFGTDGKLYGVAIGYFDTNYVVYTDGTIFSMNPDGTGYVTQYRFGRQNAYILGEGPDSPLVQAANGGSGILFYGTMELGGPDMAGTVFSFTPGATDGSGAVNVVYNFGSSGVANDAGFPGDGKLLIDAQGNFYGESGGGINNGGTVYKLSPNGAETLLHQFTFTDGNGPYGGLTLASDGNFYGTTTNGGPNNDGTVFELSPDGSTFATVYNFGDNGPADGQTPFARPVEDSDGNLLGTTLQGGLYNGSVADGVIYKIAAGLPNPVKVSSVVISPSVVTGGSASGNASGTVMLSMPAPSAGAVVTLQSSNPAAASVPASVTIAAGSSSSAFPISTSSVAANTSVTLTANYNNSTTMGAVTVAPPGASLKSVTLSPASTQGASSPTTANRVYLAAGAVANAVVTLTSSNPAVATVPSSVTIQQGYSSHVFTITTKNVISTQTVTITATYNGFTQSATLTVTPAPVTVAAVTISPASVIGGSTTTANSVVLSEPVAADTTVYLYASNPYYAYVPATITVNAGTSSQTFPIYTPITTSANSSVVTAYLNGSSQSATITVLPAPGLKSVLVNPASVQGGSAATTANRVYWTGNAPANEIVTLFSSNTAVATVPRNVTISSGSSSHAFTIISKAVTSQQTVTITAISGVVTQTATLTVTP